MDIHGQTFIGKGERELSWWEIILDEVKECIKVRLRKYSICHAYEALPDVECMRSGDRGGCGSSLKTEPGTEKCLGPDAGMFGAGHINPADTRAVTQTSRSFTLPGESPF